MGYFLESCDSKLWITQRGKEKLGYTQGILLQGVYGFSPLEKLNQKSHFCSRFRWLILLALNASCTLYWSIQFSSLPQSCLTLCNPMNRSTPGLPVHHQLPEFTHSHAHWVGDAIQPSHPLSSPSPPAPNPSQHQGLFQWVNSSHEVARVLEFQLQHQSFQWTPRTYLL